jgi:hypothetical protein
LSDAGAANANLISREVCRSPLDITYRPSDGAPKWNSIRAKAHKAIVVDGR